MGMRQAIGVLRASALKCSGAALIACAGAAVAQEAPIAGLAPAQRPEGAPVIRTYEKSPEWYAVATTGVSQPIPPSLRFLDDQGAWFTPFTHPGMSGPYDIRGWHAARAAATKASAKQSE